MQIVLKCVLPRAVGGCEAPVVYYDNDVKFDAARFAHLVRAKLAALHAKFVASSTASGDASSVAPLTSDEATSIVAQCLRRVHVIRCVRRRRTHF